MSLHDTPGRRRPSVLPSLQRDSLSTDSRRLNQNVEIITAKRTIEQAGPVASTSGEDHNLNLIFTNVQNAGPVVAFWEIAIYVATTIDGTSITNANLLFPKHSQSTVDLDEWQVIGPTNVLVPDPGLDDFPYSEDDTTTPQNIDLQKVVVRNISAGSKEILYVVRVKYVFNRG